MNVVAKKKTTRRKAKPKVAPPVNPWPERLKRLRDRLGLHQYEAAAKIKISQSQWSAFEAGKRQPTRPIAHLIDLLDSGTIQ